jgi:DNA gyrase subunit B
LKKKHYDGDHIRILENLEPIRLRPAMYIGDTGPDGLHHILEEVVANAVDEYMDGHVTAIAVKIDTERQIAMVLDNGRGIPVTKHKKTGLPLLTAVLTKLHSGGKFGHGAYTSAVAGLHGIGIKATNALSEKLSVWTVQREKVYHQTFERGEPASKVRVVKRNMNAGTCIRFLPDSAIFKGTQFNVERIGQRLRAISYLCPGLVVEFKVDDEPPERFVAEGGLVDMLPTFMQEHGDAVHLHEPIVIQEDLVDIAFAWTDGSNERWASFVNVTSTPEHGKHVTGAKKAIQKVLQDQATNGKYGKLKGDDLREGIVGVIHAHVLEPEFRGQTKRSLQNQDVEEKIQAIVESALRKFVAANPDVTKQLLEHAVLLRDAKKKLREQQKAIRETKVKQGAKSILPGKLCEASDCSPDERELFIVEGTSAFGSARDARVTLKGNVHFQEILPLRGKVKNAAEVDIDKILLNAELTSITQAIGTGIGPAFNLDKCRYKSIYLLMDADSDGKHIQALLLTFFAAHMAQLIEDGKLFIVLSPLFMGVTASQRVYGDTIEEVRAQIKGNVKTRITRFKGLGESEAADLEIYAMDPKSRNVLQVQWGGKKDQALVLAYMGKDPVHRKKIMGVVDAS